MRQRHGISVSAAAAIVGCAFLLAAANESGAAEKHMTEAYVRIVMPPHFKVIVTELDGPVLADADGHTLYKWPFKQMRVGDTGDPLGQSECTGTKSTATAGFMSPYPPGLALPDLDSRLSCTQAWPPALAASDAKPIGRWTLIT